MNTSNEDVVNSDLFRNHVSRLRASLTSHSPKQICEFIEAHTYLKGEPFSFVGHEYQREILNDPAQNIVILKSAQIGISEMSARLSVARSAMINGFSTIYTLPSATAGMAFMKSRISPIIDSSPYLRELVSGDVDNASVKKFGDSYIWVKGAQVDRQAISTPADLVVMDEVDNSDQDVLTLFESRLIHSKYALTVKLSTPTIPDFGIDAAFKLSRRKFNFAQCSCCNEWFYPEYFKHVRIPGFSDDLDKVSKRMFADPNFRWTEAYVGCPSCGSPVDLRTAKRNWVIENYMDAFFDSGYRVSPFDCPHNVKPSDLVKGSVAFERPQDFHNQRLGVPMADSETCLAREELDGALISEMSVSGGFSYVMGLDMGNVCWLTLAAVLPNNHLIIVRTEGVPLHQVVERVVELMRVWRVRMMVVDRGPMTEAVWQIQQKVFNSFAAVFVQSKSVELFKVKDQEEDRSEGVEGMRQVNISKDACMDLLMHMLRTGQVKKVSDENDEVWKDHLTDNKRIRMFKNGELVLTWVKTTKVDHLHMALVYALVASRILGVTSGSGVSLPLLGTFKIQPKVDNRRV